MANDPVFQHLERHMDDLIEHMLRRSPATYRRAWAPKVDVYETASEFVLVAELGGVSSDSVTIEVEADEVTLAGQRPAVELPVDGGRCLQLEIPFGDFERRLGLPVPVDAERARASFEDGVLVVHLPKAPRGPARVQVDVER